jgi:TP901 family phage tail tape measure protein
MAGENINRRLNIYINDKEVVNSMGGVTRAMTKTRNEIRNLNKGAEDYDEQLKKLKDTYSKLSQEQEGFKKEIAGVPGILSKIKGALGPVASGMIAAFSVGAIAAKFGQALGNAKKLIFDFEQGVADLSAITGATGKDLNFLKNAAIQLGIQTKGGAVAVLEAYKLIASAKPELLSNVAALNQVTEATLLLAKASGMEMPAAATALTDAMNQFGVDASQASVFVDALANGAKYGAAEIPQVTEALLKFGSVAKSSNVDIKESTALIELLAENGLKGADAGTALRNILLKISAPDALPKEAQSIIEKLGISMEFLKDKTIPFEEKLVALKPLLKDNAGIVKVFGLENTTAALNVIGHTDRLQELISKMGEVGTAQEQAAIKMDTVANKTELLKSKYESLILSIGKGSGVVSNFFKFWIDGASDALSSIIRLNTSWKEIYENAKNEGQKTGVSAFTRKFNALQGTGSDADIAQSIKTSAENQYKIYEKEFRDYENKKIELSKKLSSESDRKAFLSKDYDPKLKERLTKSLAEQASIIREAGKKMKQFVVTPAVIPANGGSPSIDPNADTAAAKRDKKLAAATKHAEDLLKLENDLQKQLNESRAKAAELKDGLIKDDFIREKALINSEYDGKISDLELNIKKEQEAIDKLKAGIASGKTSSEDLKSFKKQLADRLLIQEDYNYTMLLTDQTRDLKLGALQEKYLKIDYDKKQEANARELQNLLTKHNEELASITSLASAKEILEKALTPDELKKVTDLETAKKKIREQFQKEEIDLQIQHLTDLSAVMKGMLENTTLPPEQREAILKFYDDLASKIAVLKLQYTTSAPTDKKNADLSGLDFLGFSADQWADTFDSLDEFSEKLAAVELVVGAVKNAFGMYFEFLEAGEKRQLQKFEANNRKKQSALNDQLEKGFITQEVYNARNAKLDQELAKKKAEIEYKQAKRQKAMAAAQVISNTAMSIMSIWSTGGGTRFADFGISAGVLTGIATALGAAQLGLVLAQPLPNKSGFYDGGYTGSGPDRSSPGPVHYEEYVVPKKVLFSNDPVVPNIVGYLEAKRQGKNPQMPQEQIQASDGGQSSAVNSEINQQVVNSLNRNSAILEKIEEDGLPAYLVNDIKTAKKMRDKIKEVNKLETNAKL